MIPLIKNAKTIVLVNGAFPVHEIPLSALNNAECIVCCDGATQSLVDYGLEPSYIVGDLDSVSPDLKTRYASILHHERDQETNDLTKAVMFCLKMGYKDISILGATGKREDHTLGNLSLLADYDEIISVQLLTDHGVFVPQINMTEASSVAEYESFAGQQISVFSLTPQTEITYEGLAYPVEKSMFTSWWQGTLNQAESSSFQITINQGRILVFRSYE